MTKPKFFSTPDKFAAWLEKHHGAAEELLVGFYKRGAERPSMTWPESVDQALRFGWIDGVRRAIDEESYSIRFTPRKQGSTWSAVNIRRVAELEAQGLMRPAGRKAFAAREDAKSKTYSYERKEAAALDASLAAKLKANKKASAFMATLAPSYQRKIVHWVMAAKGEDVRLRRLSQAMAAFEQGEKL